MNMMKIAMKAGNVDVLGPGSRAVVWTYGCHKSCPGCVATWDGFEEMTPAQLAAWLLETGCSGVTLSGGEPFLQASALAETIALVRAQRPDINVIAYSGYTLEEITASPAMAPLLAQVDVLIDGPYVAEKDKGRPYIGSENQRMLQLTDRISHQTLDEYYKPDGCRRAVINIQGESIQMIGVPSKAQLKLWHFLTNRKEEGSHTL